MARRKRLTLEAAQEMLADANREKQEIEAQILPLMEKRDKLKKKIQPVEDEIRALNEQIKAFRQGEDGNALFEVTNEIAALSRAIGGKRHRAITAEAAPA